MCAALYFLGGGFFFFSDVTDVYYRHVNQIYLHNRAKQNMSWVIDRTLRTLVRGNTLVGLAVL